MFKNLLRPSLFFNWSQKTFKNKFSFLKQAANALQKQAVINDNNVAFEALKKREEEITTGIITSLALPHLQSQSVIEPFVAVFKVKNLDWQSLDQKPVKLIFLIGVPVDKTNLHLDFISNFSKLMLNETFASKVLNVTSYNGLIKLIDLFNQQKVQDQPAVETKKEYDFVAVTACPTGIAHTFMAKEALEAFAKKHNLYVKVETQGTDGIQNQLTSDDINNAKGVILACDRLIDFSRFYANKNVIEVSTLKAIKKPDEVYELIKNQKGKQLANSAKPTNQTQLAESEGEFNFNNFHKRIYRAILSGVSYMLPFVVFGGILIALSFLIDINNANNAGGNFGTINPVANWLNKLGGISFSLIVPILSAYIAYALVSRQGLLPGFVVGLISSGQFLLNIVLTNGTIEWLAPSQVSSGFFGAIFGGLLSACLIIVQQNYIYKKLPQSLQGIKNILFIPLFGTLFTAGLFWVINIPLIYLNYGLSLFLNIMNSPILAPLLGFVIGLMMCFDLGGPINKAAYVFGVVSLQNQNAGTIAMAAAMLSGMVPPLSIALAASIRKSCFDKQELPAAYACYLIGLSFISEGAIPFVVKKPKVMLTANLIAGAICGALTGAFALSIRAPHGGVFVFALLKTTLQGIEGATLQTGVGIGLALVCLIISMIVGSSIIIGYDLIAKHNQRKQNLNS
ncbi:fructose-specific PTS transporter subunit EIIC [Mycoplasmoides genitalium]